ncbi:MAG: hypothetical protein IPL76_03965 [Gemmatimonadetes bacterium]|nr:hypothetical protein [Gemmatimonadota bacterium]
MVELTGITQEMVTGQRIDDAAATALVERADLVIAHNAAFDRRFLNRRLPACAQKPWACSQREIPWKREVGASAALEFLLVKHAGMFFQATAPRWTAMRWSTCWPPPSPRGHPAPLAARERPPHHRAHLGGGRAPRRQGRPQDPWLQLERRWRRPAQGLVP